MRFADKIEIKSWEKSEPFLRLESPFRWGVDRGDFSPPPGIPLPASATTDYRRWRGEGRGGLLVSSPFAPLLLPLQGLFYAWRGPLSPLFGRTILL